MSLIIRSVTHLLRIRAQVSLSDSVNHSSISYLEFHSEREFCRVRASEHSPLLPLVAIDESNTYFNSEQSHLQKRPS
jgi:hypothetical protein